MTNSYQNLMSSNKIVPHALHGFGKSHWFNYTMTVDTSIKSFELRVYANTSQEALFYAGQLKNYIESNPMQNSSGHDDDISIGTKAPILDPISSAYLVVMIFNSGMLQIK
jgi:hypothetical protein